MGYRDYLLRRALSTIPMFIGLSVLIFTLARVIPGNPARLALGPRATDEAVQQLREQMGLNEPIWQQYLDYMIGLLQGDFGRSLTTNHNVATDIGQFFPATFELTTFAMLIAIAVGVPLGVVAGQNKDELEDNAVGCSRSSTCRCRRSGPVSSCSFSWHSTSAGSRRRDGSETCSSCQIT
jgi:peptide/nickel transport system permease protein